MKKIIRLLPRWLVLTILALLFLVAWPLILIGIGIKVLFDEKASDSQKITGAIAAVFTLFGLIIVGLFVMYQYPIVSFLDRFPWQSLITLAIIGLCVLAILQKIFPNWKWLKKDSNLT